MSRWKNYLKNVLFQAAPKDVQHAEDDAIDEILRICRISCRDDAPSNPENIYRICHAVAKQYKLYPAMRSLMKRKWGAESMRDLDSHALKDLFYYMRAMESLKKRL
ncbi:hypothetical protein C4J81_17200 [Deltaproteobacteria bacterium Smac51]|nr:hypothetical protein C4J81_17200 [Deltaproteobacteria bacterium Smac51]